MVGRPRIARPNGGEPRQRDNKLLVKQAQDRRTREREQKEKLPPPIGACSRCCRYPVQDMVAIIDDTEISMLLCQYCVRAYKTEGWTLTTADQLSVKIAE